MLVVCKHKNQKTKYRIFTYPLKNKFPNIKMICVEQVYLECVIPENNRKAFYRLVAGQDLFGLKPIHRIVS
jgi:hypothetical protein